MLIKLLLGKLNYEIYPCAFKKRIFFRLQDNLSDKTMDNIPAIMESTIHLTSR